MDQSRDQEGELERTQPWVVDAECQRGNRNGLVCSKLFTLAEGVEHLTANFCLHLYRFPRADLTQLPETRWLESTEIYSLIVLETRSLP